MESGDKIHEELHLWAQAHELAGCDDQLNLGGNASLEHVARIIQSFVDALSDSASVDWSKQKFFVTTLRGWRVELLIGRMRVQPMRSTSFPNGFGHISVYDL